MSTFFETAKVTVPKMLFWVFFVFCILQAWIHIVSAYRCVPHVRAVFQNLTSPTSVALSEPIDWTVVSQIKLAPHINFHSYYLSTTLLAAITCLVLIWFVLIRSKWVLAIAGTIAIYNLWFGLKYFPSLLGYFPSKDFFPETYPITLGLSLPLLIFPTALLYLGELGAKSTYQCKTQPSKSNG